MVSTLRWRLQKHVLWGPRFLWAEECDRPTEFIALYSDRLLVQKCRTVSTRRSQVLVAILLTFGEGGRSFLIRVRNYDISLYCKRFCVKSRIVASQQELTTSTTTPVRRRHHLTLRVRPWWPSCTDDKRSWIHCLVRSFVHHRRLLLQNARRVSQAYNVPVKVASPTGASVRIERHT